MIPYCPGYEKDNVLAASAFPYFHHMIDPEASMDKVPELESVRTAQQTVLLIIQTTVIMNNEFACRIANTDVGCN
jgi:hypothetical protein